MSAEHETRSGWTTVGDADTWRALRERLERAAREAESAHEEHVAEGRALHVKFGALRGGAAWRYGLRAALGTPPPRLAEYRNLAWLRAQGFRAVRPLLAGVLRRGGRIVFQFLATETAPGATTLRARLSEKSALEAEPSAARRHLLEEVAKDVARLHAAGFVHRDLYPRNLLVDDADPRPVHLDAWRGGPGRGRPGRDAAYDLGCLFTYLPDLATEDEVEHVWRTYVRERRAHGSLDEARLERSARRHREALVERILRRNRTPPALPRSPWGGPRQRS